MNRSDKHWRRLGCALLEDSALRSPSALAEVPLLCLTAIRPVYRVEKPVEQVVSIQ